MKFIEYLSVALSIFVPMASTKVLPFKMILQVTKNLFDRTSIGRKKTMLYLTLPLFIGSILVSVSSSADNIFVLCVGRFLTGSSFRQTPLQLWSGDIFLQSYYFPFQLTQFLRISVIKLAQNVPFILNATRDWIKHSIGNEFWILHLRYVRSRYI